jgi:serine/threonine protein kinase
MCSSTFKLKIVSELPFKTIKEDIRERAASNSRKYFAEDELWSILYSCCHALYSLYINKFSHESLTSDQIYIDTEGIIKVADSLLVNGTKNYLSLMNEELKTENIRYISPELRNLVDDNNFYQYEKEKSDVYILGMIILEISNLAPLKYYDIKTKRFQFDIIQSAFDDFKTRYSLKLYEIVNKMLTPDYNVRPTFEEIIENIE